jgi:soluble lytic murein transglycosylase-like protein
MSTQDKDLRVGGRPPENTAVDLRDQLRDARYRRGRVFLPVLAVAALVAGGNTLWVLGVVHPRVERAEAVAELARDAEQRALGELSLLRHQHGSLEEIFDYSSRYRIPADLARAIHSIAVSEDLEPGLAFRLVATESSFRRNALSEAGAVGYTQVLPSTALWLDPTVKEADLYERDVNLRLGFRYLRLLLEENGGDMRLALLAYNRGPGTVRSIVARGGDPANGYATRIMGSE